MKLFKLFQEPRLVFALFSALITIVLLFEVPGHNVGYADSDEFLAVAKDWGVAHPPGYVFYTGLLNLAMKIPMPGTTLAARAHAVSALSVGAALYFILLSTQLILDKLYRPPRRNRFLGLGAIIIAGLMFVANKQLFLYAPITEKYIFLLPFLSLVIYSSVRIFFSVKQQFSDFVLLGISSAILISHHQSMVFILPFIGYILWPHIKKHVGHIAAFVAAFTLVTSLWLGVLYWRLQVAPEPTWYQQPGIQGLIDTVTRASFRGTIYYQDIESSGYFHSINAAQVISSIKSYLLLVGQWYYWWSLVPLIIGLYFLYKKDLKIFWLAMSPFLLIGVAMAGYLGWPGELNIQAATVRFYIPSLILLVPLFAIGIYELSWRFGRSFQVLGLAKKWSMPTAMTLPLVLALFSLQATVRNVDFHRFTLIKDLYGNVIESVEPNSIVTCYSDPSCFALLYEQKINGRRPDVDVVPVEWPLVQNSLAQKQLQRFTYAQNPYRMFDIVTWNVDKRPVYAVDISRYYFSMFGLDNALLFYVPSGYAGQITKEMPANIEKSPTSLSAELENHIVPEFDIMRRILVNSVTQTHFTNAYMWLKLGERDQAQQELNTGVNIAYTLYDTEKQMAGSGRTEIERIMKDERYAYGEHSPSAEKLLQEVPDLLAKGKNNQAYYLARAGITVDPLHIQSRLELAKMYLKMEDFAFANLELNNILSIDPNNTAAKDLQKSFQ